jgi:hypothetical protein
MIDQYYPYQHQDTSDEWTQEVDNTVMNHYLGTVLTIITAIRPGYSNSIVAQGLQVTRAQFPRVT